VNKKQLQLVGLTAIFIASKYEEIYPPNIRDFIIATDSAYSKQHLIKMEVDMLKVIDFQVTFPTA
jgi:Cyclin